MLSLLIIYCNVRIQLLEKSGQHLNWRVCLLLFVKCQQLFGWNPNVSLCENMKIFLGFFSSYLMFSYCSKNMITSKASFSFVHLVSLFVGYLGSYTSHKPNGQWRSTLYRTTQSCVCTISTVLSADFKRIDLLSLIHFAYHIKKKSIPLSYRFYLWITVEHTQRKGKIVIIWLIMYWTTKQPDKQHQT